MLESFSNKQEHQITSKIKNFLQNMVREGKQVVCVTSGGTSVPLQQKTVRSIQNFSTGLRGSLLAQKFLQRGCAVIFYHRTKSILPFTGGISINTVLLSQNPSQEFQKLKNIVITHAKYQKYILYLTFQTIYEYLEGALLIKQLLPVHSIYVLCAAVSDFIPKEVPENKIHTDSNLTIQLTNSPKILGKLVKEEVLTVSFKLQTDQSKLPQRMSTAIQKYKVDCVIGNILNNKEYIRILDKSGEIREYHSSIEQNIVQHLLSNATKN